MPPFSLVFLGMTAEYLFRNEEIYNPWCNVNGVFTFLPALTCKFPEIHCQRKSENFSEKSTNIYTDISSIFFWEIR
jgi:hypothetical protein